MSQQYAQQQLHLLPYASPNCMHLSAVSAPLTLSSLKRGADAVLQPDDFSKRPRLDSGVAFSVYPQRPGEKLCAHYMTSRTCGFGDSCRFDHPSWVPLWGIPNWREVSASSASSVPALDPACLPQRPGERDCAFYMKTGDCKYSSRCRFNHPKDRNTTLLEKTPSDEKSLEDEGQSLSNSLVHSTSLPARPGEPDCVHFMKTGSCKYGSSCRFNHPEIRELGSTSSSGFPQRPHEADCAYYLKYGTCSFGSTCRFHHPHDRQPSGARTPTIKLTLAGLPRREGESICAYYMKTAACKYGSSCKFDHPPPGEVAAKLAEVSHSTVSNPSASLEGLKLQAVTGGYSLGYMVENQWLDRSRFHDQLHDQLHHIYSTVKPEI